jgi:hypothetical protein
MVKMKLNSRFKRLIPVMTVCLSFVLCIAFLRFYLDQTATNLVDDFRRQNFAELAGSDTFSLANRLNSMSSSINWECISGERAGKVFYEQKKSSCKQNFLNKKIVLDSPENSEMRIMFTIALPSELLWGAALFLIFQLMLLFFIRRTTIALEAEKYVRQQEIANLAEQVAHDIRAPLAVLETMMRREDGQEQILVKGAVEQIQSIAHELLAKYRSGRQELSEPRIEKSLYTLIQQLIKERECLHKKVRFSFVMDEAIGRDFSMDRKLELQRILSNLLNNSIEAQSSSIELEIREQSGTYVISLRDNGSGIPSELLKRIGEKGASGKNNGNGLGLFHAKQKIEDWGGSLVFASEVNNGTRVQLIFPVCGTIIQIDDDADLRKIWEVAAKNKGKEYRGFSSVEEFLAAKSALDASANIYIDSQLKSAEPGELSAKKIFDLGFKNIFLCTGFRREKFALAAMPWLQGVVGKEPPWLT